MCDVLLVNPSLRHGREGEACDLLSTFNERSKDAKQGFRATAYHEWEAMKSTLGYRAVEKLRRSWVFPMVHKIARSAARRGAAL